MQVQLNADKHDLCFIGRYCFTFEDPGPMEVRVEELNPNEKVQMYAAWKNGKLLIDDSTDLEKAVIVNNVAPAPQVAQRAELSAAPQPIDEKALRKLLREKIPVIKQQVQTMKIRELKKLLDLEKETKNRKQIINALSAVVDKHTSTVTSTVGTEDIENSSNPAEAGAVRGSLSIQQYLDSVSDVVESEVEEVTIRLGADDSSED